MKAACNWNVALLVSAGLVSSLASLLGAASSYAAPIDPVTWKTHLQTASFFAGDSFGTIVDDVYLDAANPATNFNGAMNPGTGTNTFRVTGAASGARVGQLVWRVTW